MTRRASSFDAQPPKVRCLTEFSVPVLIGGALAVSAVLWTAIAMVL